MSFFPARMSTPAAVSTRGSTHRRRLDRTSTGLLLLALVLLGLVLTQVW